MNKKKPFTDKRWHDNPAKGCKHYPGPPLTEEEEKKADEEHKEWLQFLKEKGIHLNEDETT